MSPEKPAEQTHIPDEIRCPITRVVCVVLEKQYTHPGVERLRSESGTITITNNSKNADLARQIAISDPLACETLQDDENCGAIYSRFLSVWGHADIDKIKKILE